MPEEPTRQSSVQKVADLREETCEETLEHNSWVALVWTQMPEEEPVEASYQCSRHHLVRLVGQVDSSGQSD